MSAVPGERVVLVAMKLSSDSVVVVTPHMVAADMGEEVIVLHLEDGYYFGLENVSARIWKLLQKPVRVGEIERLLLEEYDVEPQKCREEVLSLLSNLVDKGLVEVRES
jgi:hypothetical protein